MCAGIALQSHSLAIGHPFLSNTCKIHRFRQRRVTSMATQAAPKWSKGCPNIPQRNPKSAQAEKKDVERHPKNKTNHKNIYANRIYANS